MGEVAESRARMPTGWDGAFFPVWLLQEPSAPASQLLTPTLPAIFTHLGSLANSAPSEKLVGLSQKQSKYLKRPSVKRPPVTEAPSPLWLCWAA